METPKSVDFFYIKDEQGRFIPEHLLARPKELAVYLAGYTNQENNVPENSMDNERRKHLLAYGESIAKDRSFLVDAANGKYKSKPLQPIKTFSGSVENYRAPINTTVRSAAFAPAWAFPGQDDPKY